MMILLIVFGLTACGSRNNDTTQTDVVNTQESNQTQIDNPLEGTGFPNPDRATEGYDVQPSIRMEAVEGTEDDDYDRKIMA